MIDGVSIQRRITETHFKLDFQFNLTSSLNQDQFLPLFCAKVSVLEEASCSNKRVSAKQQGPGSSWFPRPIVVFLTPRDRITSVLSVFFTHFLRLESPQRGIKTTEYRNPEESYWKLSAGWVVFSSVRAKCDASWKSQRWNLKRYQEIPLILWGHCRRRIADVTMLFLWDVKLIRRSFSVLKKTLSFFLYNQLQLCGAAVELWAKC